MYNIGGESMKTLSRFISLFLVMSFLSFQSAYAVDPSLNVMGTVTGKGDVRVETSFNTWVDINERTFPSFNGMHLKTGNGTATINLRGGSRLETGKNSEIILSSDSNKHSVNLITGGLSFTVPEDTSLLISTPSAIIETTSTSVKRVAFGTGNFKRGIVLYDGKGTRVISLAGAITVRDTNSASLQVVTAGNAVYFGQENAGIKSAVLPLPEGSAPATGGAATGGAAIGALPVIIGGLALVGGTYLIVNSNVKPKAASPSRP